ncbi:helix-turn-helix domain-containing protein [Streptomyces sp. NPDC001809]
MTTHTHVQERSPRPRARSSRPTLPSPADRAALRQAWQLSERQVADAFGVTVATVRSWESGRTSPTGKRRAAYAAFLSGLASGLASGQSGPFAPPPPSVVRVPSRPARADASLRSAEPEVRSAAVPAQRITRRAVDLEALPVGGGYDPVSPERKRRLRLTAAAVGVWTVALHLILTMPTPPL